MNTTDGKRMPVDDATSRKVIAEASDGIVLVDEKGHIIFWNAAMEAITGKKRADVEGRNLLDVQLEAAPEHLRADMAIPDLKAGMTRMFETGEAPWLNKSSEMNIVTPDGIAKTVESRIFLIEGASGYRACAFIRDITARKAALEEVRIREQELRIMQKASMAVLEHTSFEEASRRIFDLAREITGAKSGYIALLSDDGSENEVLFLEDGGLPCNVNPDLSMPIRGLRAEAYRSGSVVMDNDFMNSEWVKFMPSGHVMLKNVLFSPLPVEGKVVGIMGLANKDGDFTERDLEVSEKLGTIAAIALKNSRARELLKDREASLEKALEEKSFLMRELNHRVKNNLAIITSLISLKSVDGAESPAMEDLRNQIDAIRLVYEHLHREDEVSRIQFKTYCGEFLEALFESSSELPVEVDLKIGDIFIDSKTAVHLGLIINEIATNTIKHAFMPGSEGRFIAEMNEDEDGYTLILGNNGRPFPEDVDMENPKTMGLRFISAMTEQLGGTVSLKRSPHPEFTFRFFRKG